MDERVSKRGKQIEWEEDEENLKWIGMNMRATKSWIVDADTYVYVFNGMLKKNAIGNDAIQLLFNWLQVSFEMKRSFVIKCLSDNNFPHFIFIYPHQNVQNALARPNNLHEIAIIFGIWCISWIYAVTPMLLLLYNFLLLFYWNG